MRIIAGKKRGCPILAPAGLATRPTLDRVREAVFGMLQAEIPGSSVLDLFAGSGAMGLEAVSRYADSAVFCDRSAASAECVRKNIQSLGFGGQCTVYQCDFLQAIARAASAGIGFDVVFLDPPYGQGLAERAIAALLESGVLNPGALLVWEHAFRPEPDVPPGMSLCRRKKYGDVGISVLERNV